MQMGHRDATGWVVDVQSPCKLKPGQIYNVLVAVHGTTVTMLVDGTEVFSNVFAPRVVDGYSYGLNTGMVGMGSDNSRGSFDNVIVQRLPPEITFESTEDFSDGSTDLFTASAQGQWQITSGQYYALPDTGENRTISLMDIGLQNGLDLNSILQLQAAVNTSAVAGVVFDYYSVDDFKFAAIDAASDQVVIGHYTAIRGWRIDVAVQTDIVEGTDCELFVSIKGSSVSVSLDGQVVLGFVFNGVAVDGSFGLIADSTSYFDDLVVKTDDPNFQKKTESLIASRQVQEPTETALTYEQLAPVVQEAIIRFAEIYQLDTADVDLLNSINFEIVDLGGLTLGATSGSTVQIDIDAAGYGWFVDTTPSEDVEFTMLADGTLLADSSSLAVDRMDMLSVVMHELGHVLGYDDLVSEESSNDLMNLTLDAGVRRLYTDEPATLQLDAHAAVSLSSDNLPNKGKLGADHTVPLKKVKHF
jgi:hypothetical protein